MMLVETREMGEFLEAGGEGGAAEDRGGGGCAPF